MTGHSSSRQSIADMLPVPRPGDLRTLPVVAKPNWRGLVAYSVGWSLGLMAWLGHRWSREVLGEWTQVIAGIIYHPVHKYPSASLRGHESVHDWQARHWGGIRYSLGYLLRQERRRHYEAMAYAYEVVQHYRSAEERAGMASQPIYRCSWTRDEARELIDRYADALRDAGWPP